MSTAHTAGPWLVTFDSKFPAELAIDATVDGETIHIALVHGVGTDEATQANAAVIVAAPELLKAANDLLDAVGSNTPRWLRAELRLLEAAALKAQGRPS